MANRTHSETENSRYGRYINLDILDDLLESIHELKNDQKFILSLDESVEDTLHDVIKTYLKWHQIKVIPNAKKNVLGTLHQSPNRLVLVAEEKKSFPYFYDNLDTEINVDKLKENVLAHTGYHDMTFQSSCDGLDIFTGIMTIREYYRHNMKAHKDCVITVNNADINTINALTYSNSTALAVSCIDNNIDIETLTNYCEESAEYISCIILTDDVENVKEVCDIAHAHDVMVFKTTSYNDILKGKYLLECGVDVIGFGPVATTEKLHYYLPMHKQDNTGLSLGFGTVSQTAYNRQSIEICKNIPLVNV